MFRKLDRFFDRLEDRVRGWLSHRPILYAFVGGVGIVLFWRGVWHTADLIMPFFLAPDSEWFPKDPVMWLDGPLTLFISVVILLAVGIFVSEFIGNEIIISGMKHEKKVAEKTEEEIGVEEISLKAIVAELKKIREEIEALKKK